MPWRKHWPLRPVLVCGISPRLPALVGLGLASVLGPTRGGVANGGNSPLLLRFLGAHPPNPLGWGCAPSTPALIKVGEGQPFSKRLTLVGVNGAHPPHPLPGGFAPWTPQFCPPSLAEGSPTFWVPLVAGLLIWATRPFFVYFGGTSPIPLGRGPRPPEPPLPTPVG